MKWKILIVILILIIVIPVIFALFREGGHLPIEQPKQMTTGPEPSRAGDSQEDGWKEVDFKGVKFRYPQDLATKYIKFQKWPPAVEATYGIFSCKEGERTVRKEINGTDYCIESQDEGAAGTVYTTYTYTLVKDNKVVKMTFTLGYPQCGNYEEPQKTECETEKEMFSLDSLMDRIAQSVKF